MPLFLKDTRIFLLVTFMSIAVIQIEIFGLIGRIVYGLLIAYGVIFIAVNFKNLHLLKHPIFYIACAYYLYFILANLINGSFVRRGPAIIQYFLLCIIAFSIRPIEDIKRDFTDIAKFMIVMGLIQAICSISMALIFYLCPAVVYSLPSNISSLYIQMVGGFPVRASGLILNANFTGGYEFVSCVLSIFLLLSHPTSKKWTYLAILNIILALYTIFIFCASRTYMLGTIGTLGVFFLLYFLVAFKDDRRAKHFFYLCLLSLILVLLLLLILFFIIPSTREFFLNRVVRVDSLSDGTGRLNVWKNAWELGKTNRIIGIDFDLLEQATTLSNAHNIILEMLTFGGVPTLVLFLIYFIYTISIIVRIISKKENNIDSKIFYCFLLSYLIGYFITGMTESDINRLKMTTLLFSISMGFIHVINYQLQKQEKLN